MKGLHILVVDDERRIREMVREYFIAEGAFVDEANDGYEALSKLENSERPYDAIILDIMMPRLDGWATCRQIRQNYKTPIIMLSARGEEYDKLFGFELGVDDYMVKPFSPRELIARVKAIIRRSQGEKTDVADYGGLRIDYAGRNVTVDTERVSLAPREYDLLAFLSRNEGVVFSRDKLLNEVWGYDFYGDYRTVDTHVKALRNALGKYRGSIATVWGVGYRFEWRKEA